MLGNVFVTLHCRDKEYRNYNSMVIYFIELEKNVGKSNCWEQFRKFMNRYKRIGYNPYIMRQTACLVVIPIMADSYALLFICTAVVRASDSMVASSKNFQ